MQYKYTIDQNWEDYSAGRILHNFPGHPAFPVRLASELFQQAYAQWQAVGGDGRCNVFDPCCGGAYHLAVLGLLHSDRIARISAGDIDSKALELAGLNLRLLNDAGFQQRMDEINVMLKAYGKTSHQDAMESACRIQTVRLHEVPFSLFHVDALSGSSYAALDTTFVDIVFSDVPYGLRSAWSGDCDTEIPLEQFLENLLPLLKPESVVIIAADKTQKIRHSAFRRIEKFSIGKRQAALLQKAE